MSKNNMDTEKVEILLEDWFRRVRQHQHIHYKCANFFSSMNLVFGIPAIALAIIVGTAVFASIEKDATGKAKIILGLVSLGAAILSILQTFLRYSETSEKHRAASSRYGALRKRLEFLKTFHPKSESEIKSVLVELKKEWDFLTESAPEVPAFIWRRSKKNLTARRLLKGQDAT